MNVLIITAILFATFLFVLFLLGRRCNHEWQNIHKVSKQGSCTYIQQCKNSGKLRREEFDD